MATKQNAHLSQVGTMQTQGRSQKLDDTHARSSVESHAKTKAHTNSHIVSSCQEQLLDRAGTLSLSTSKAPQVNSLPLQASNNASLAIDHCSSSVDNCHSLIDSGHSLTNSGISETNLGRDSCGSHTFRPTFSRGKMHSQPQARHVRHNEFNGASNHDVLNSQQRTLQQLHTQEPAKHDLSFQSFKTQEINSSHHTESSLHHIEHPNRVKVALPKIEQTLIITSLQSTEQLSSQSTVNSTAQANSQSTLTLAESIQAKGKHHLLREEQESVEAQHSVREKQDSKHDLTLREEDNNPAPSLEGHAVLNAYHGAQNPLNSIDAIADEAKVFAIDANAEAIAAGASAAQRCLHFSGEHLNVFASRKTQAIAEKIEQGTPLSDATKCSEQSQSVKSVTQVSLGQASFSSKQARAVQESQRKREEQLAKHFAEHAAAKKPQTIVNVATQQGELLADIILNNKSLSDVDPAQDPAKENAEQNNLHQAKTKTSHKNNSSKNSMKEKSVTKKPQSKLNDAKHAALKSQVQGKPSLESRLDETSDIEQVLETAEGKVLDPTVDKTLDLAADRASEHSASDVLEPIANKALEPATVEMLDVDKAELSSTRKGRMVAKNKAALSKNATTKNSLVKETSTKNETPKVAGTKVVTRKKATTKDVSAKVVAKEQQAAKSDVKSQKVAKKQTATKAKLQTVAKEQMVTHSPTAAKTKNATKTQTATKTADKITTTTQEVTETQTSVKTVSKACAAVANKTTSKTPLTNDSDIANTNISNSVSESASVTDSKRFSNESSHSVDGREELFAASKDNFMPVDTSPKGQSSAEKAKLQDATEALMSDMQDTTIKPELSRVASSAAKLDGTRNSAMVESNETYGSYIDPAINAGHTINADPVINAGQTINAEPAINANKTDTARTASGFATENSSAIWPMFGWEHLRPAHRVTCQDVEPRYLELLATKYPNRIAAFSEIINLQAILNLPKGTEHFVSDIHGEYEAFRHILNNCSGVIKEKVDLLFTDLSTDEKADLCTLIYYPQEVLSDLESRGLLTAGWYREVLSRLISLCKYLSAKYTRSKVRKAINSDYAYIIDELLHAQEGESNSRALYHSKIIDTILHIHAAYHFVTSLCALSKRLAVDHLHVVGDIFDRGANPDKVMSLLMDYHSLDIQWGNHDILWMGAACGSEACMATVLRNNINYFNCNLLESAYGISLRKLNDFAQRTYRSPVKELSSLNLGVSSAHAASGTQHSSGNLAASSDRNLSGNLAAISEHTVSSDMDTHTAKYKAGDFNKAGAGNRVQDVNSQSIGDPNLDARSNCAFCSDTKTPEEQIQWINLVLGYSEKKLQGLDNHQLQLVYQYAMEQAQRRTEAQAHTQVQAQVQAHAHALSPSQSSNLQQRQDGDASVQDLGLQAAQGALGKDSAKSGLEQVECQGKSGVINVHANNFSSATTIMNAQANTGNSVIASASASLNTESPESTESSEMHRPDDYDPHHATAQALLDEYEARSKARKNKKNRAKADNGKKKPMKLKALVKMLEKAQTFKATADIYEQNNQISKDKMVKAITVIALKLQGQLILRNPEFNMNDRLLLDKMDLEHGTVTIDGKTYQLNTTDLPTIDPEHPFELSAEEAEVMQRIKESFLNSRELQREVGFLFSHGSIYKRFNGNLLYHGCVPMTEDGQFKQINCHGRALSGKAFLDYCEAVARRAYDKHDEQSLDFMYFLWCGINSPLSGRIMKPFERYFIDDKSSHVEPRDPYYSFYYREDTCRKVLTEFNLDPDTGHIINGHTPIKVKQGESPIRGNGKLLVIDGGLCSAYHSTTGIAGYTLIFSSHGLTLQAHRPFVSTQEAIAKKLDIESVSNEVEHYTHRLQVADSDTGIKLKRAIFELEALLDAYRQGILPESSNNQHQLLCMVLSR